MQVHPHKHTQPDRIDIQHQQHRCGDRDHDKDDLEGVEDEAQEEHDDHYHCNGSERPARQIAEEFMHQIVAAHHAEHDRKDRGPEKDHKDHAGDCGRRYHRLFEHAKGQTPAQCGEDHGPDGTDGCGLCRGGDAAQNRP